MNKFYEKYSQGMGMSLYKKDNILIVKKTRMPILQGLLGYLGLLICLTFVSIAWILILAFLLAALNEQSKEALLLVILAVVFLLGSGGPLFGIFTICEIIFPYVRYFDFEGKTVENQVFFFKKKARLADGDLEVLIQPLYSRGAWGYRFVLRVGGKKSFKMLNVGIVGDERDARREAQLLLRGIKQNFTALKVTFDEKWWIKNRNG